MANRPEVENRYALTSQGEVGGSRTTFMGHWLGRWQACGKHVLGRVQRAHEQWKEPPAYETSLTSQE